MAAKKKAAKKAAKKTVKKAPKKKAVKKAPKKPRVKRRALSYEPPEATEENTPLELRGLVEAQG